MTPDRFPPEDLDDKQLFGHPQLPPAEVLRSPIRPATIVAALMEQSPEDTYQESLEDAEPVIAAVSYATECLGAEDIFILNAMHSEGVNYTVLAKRLGVSRASSWRLHKRALERLRVLLLNFKPIRERLGMTESWNAAAMAELVAIAGYEGDVESITLAGATHNVAAAVALAVEWQNAGREKYAVDALTNAARASVAYLRCCGQWSLIDMHRLLCRKQHDYGHGNINKFGLVGVMVRASDKAERLKNLATHPRPVGPLNETLLDTFFDVVGYGVIARMLKSETFDLPLDEGLDDGEEAA